MTERCANCPGEHRCVRPSGPVNCPYEFVGEAPGIDEDRQGTPFCGKTGQEVNEHYLPLAGIRRPKVRFTNAIRCLPSTPRHKLDLSKPDHRELLSACADHHLYPELSQNSGLRLIVPMGAFACYAIDPAINLEYHHGIPLETTGWGLVFPMWHPAGGVHEPKKMLQIRTDWYRLRQYTEGTLKMPVDPYPDPDYKEITDGRELHAYLVNGHHLPLACDTEVKRDGGPYCISLSNRAGTGRVIRSGNQGVLRQLQRHLDRWQGPVLFHNWLFDGEVVEEMGLRIDWRRCVDTMVRVFNIGNLPQGLKALAYRELGMEMQDFDDLVTPYSRELVLDYYRHAVCEDWEVPPEQMVRNSSGEWKKYKPQGLATKLKRFWTDYAKSRDKEIFDTWTHNWEAHHAEVESRLGAWPGKCISHVPWADVVHYACRDADATIRLWPLIQHIESRVGKTTQERYRDAA